jgi:hypothetical protein
MTTTRDHTGALACATVRDVAVQRLARAVADLALMAAPIAVGLITIALTLVYWPSVFIGLPALAAVGWYSRRHTERVEREHHG